MIFLVKEIFHDYFLQKYNKNHKPPKEAIVLNKQFKIVVCNHLKNNQLIFIEILRLINFSSALGRNSGFVPRFFVVL